MDKILENSLLFDFYGELLTEKQKEIFKFHIEEDLSLSEIADELKITRQSVHDSLKHSMKTLEDYEAKLGLVAKFMEQKKELEDILNMLNKDKNTIDIDKINEKIKKLVTDNR